MAETNKEVKGEEQKKAKDTAQSACNGLLAYLVTWSKYPEMISIYSSLSRGKARALCYRAIIDAGFSPRWTDISVKRLPSHDTDAVILGRQGFIKAQ